MSSPAEDGPVVGELLGQGGNKEVFAYGPDHAIGFLKPGKDASILAEELALLNRLKELGLPVVGAKRVVVEGRPALVFERFAQGSKDVVRLSRGKVRTVGSSNLLNARSISDLNAIRRTMVNKGISIDDLQFLIAKDGRVVIADPLRVAMAKPSKSNLRTIDFLIKAARSNK